MMRHQEWRMFGLGMAVLFGVCVAHREPVAARDDPPRRIKVQGGPAKKGRKPAASADAAYAASRRAYEALPLADRKAVQESLVWVAGYRGTADGAFGKRTRDALIAFEKGDKGLNQDAVIDKGEFRRLMEAAKKAKEGVRFTMVADKASGIVIGLPLKLLTKRTAVAGGTRYASSDYGFVVETTTKAESEGGLEGLYEKLSADKDDRTVGYKTFKPDWFVVSGETGQDGDKHFYSRFERKPGRETTEIRGYTVLYDSERANELDRYAIAIANSVEPFPNAGAVAAFESPGVGDEPKTSPQTAAAAAAEAPPHAQFTATAVVVGPGKAVSVLPAACTSPTSGRQELKVETRDAASGLATLQVAGGRPLGAAVQEPALASGDSLVIVGYADTGDRPVLGVASGEVLLASPPGRGQAETRIFAPLQENAAGSAVFDRTGAFRGVIGRLSAKPRLVAGIVPQASHPLLVGEALAQLLADASPAPSPTSVDRKRTAGEIAAGATDSLIAIDCVR